MNYRIVYLLKGESKKYAERIIKELYKKFGVKAVYSGKNPAHITLKYRFETKNLKIVEEAISKVCNSINKSSFEIGGIGNFSRHTLFLKVKPSREMVLFEKSLVSDLNKLNLDEDPSLVQFDKTLYKNFHVCLADKDIVNKFDEINDFLKRYNKRLVLQFDNIHLIKKPKNKWVVQKRFRIK